MMTWKRYRWKAGGILLLALRVLVAVKWVAAEEQRRKQAAATAVLSALEERLRRNNPGMCEHCFRGVIESVSRTNSSVLHVLLADGEGLERRAVVERYAGRGQARVGSTSDFACRDKVEGEDGVTRFTGCFVGPYRERIAHERKPMWHTPNGLDSL